MWLFSETGVYSIVQSRNNRDELVVRTRFREDLDRLRERYLPSLGPVLSHRGTDYQYRAIARKEDFATAHSSIARGIGYTNFKSHIWETPGKERHDAYTDVWTVLRRASLKRNRRAR
jgi:hypothetical protein